MLSIGLAVVAAATVGAARAAPSCVPPLHPRIAEIFYDAVGDDQGREFVEFFNPHPAALPLAGVRLEVGDGSAPGRWTLRWTGDALDTVAAGGRFVVGGPLVDAAPKATAGLDLQNGPDAVRVAWPDGAVEVLGYGALEFAEHFCGAPAADAAAGTSLARLPDDVDLGSNALDFRPAAPSPGKPNQRRRDAALLPGSMTLDPEQPAPGAPCALSAVIENHGLDPFVPGEVAVIATDLLEGRTVASGMAPPLAAYDTARVVLDLPGLAPGKRRFSLRAILPGDEAADNDADSLQIRVGPGPLRMTELQFHPLRGEGEWIEVLNDGEAWLDLATFRLADRSSGGSAPAPSPAVLASRSLALLAQNRSELLRHYPALDSTRVWQVSPWPSLNNTDDATGVADVLTLREADSTPSERLAYSAAGVPAGVPLERLEEGVWAPARSPTGSPLEPPRVLGKVAGRFDVEPRLLALGGTGARLRWDLPWARAKVAFDLYDLAGRPRGRLLPETAAAARGEHLWVPAGLPGGVYLVVLSARSEASGETMAVTRAVRVVAGR